MDQTVAATGPPTLSDGTANIPFDILNGHYFFTGGNLTVVITNTANNYVLADAIAITAVAPEPSTFLLCGLGAIGLVIAARRRRRV